MCIDWRISSGASQILAIAVWNVPIGVDVSLGQSKIDDEHHVAVLPFAHQEVVRLYVLKMLFALMEK